MQKANSKTNNQKETDGQVVHSLFAFYSRPLVEVNSDEEDVQILYEVMDSYRYCDTHTDHIDLGYMCSTGNRLQYC